MAKVSVLIEIDVPRTAAFSAHTAALNSPLTATEQAAELVREVDLSGVELVEGFAPVPLFAEETVLGAAGLPGFAQFASPLTNADETSRSTVIAARVDAERLEELSSRPNVTIYPNSELTLLQESIDVRPFRPAVPIGTIRALLGAYHVWAQGFFGQNVVVAIVDEGVDGTTYPVVGGFSLSASRRPGSAPVTSHGSMCAADVLVAAPYAWLYDYPFLGVPDSGGALTMYQAILEQRRLNGTPHIINNSYGFVGVPPVAQFPTHEIHDIDHPLHRKIREVIASGAAAFFAAGNCGAESPSSRCQASGIGPGRSIHASNSLQEVITIGAVNSRAERIGYSSQGPGMFQPEKPDACAHSHFLGNFGPGRPGGIAAQLYDNGTSAASPLAAGVGALLLSAFAATTPVRLKQALLATAVPVGAAGWNANTGHGIINASAACAYLGANQFAAGEEAGLPIAAGATAQPAATRSTRTTKPKAASGAARKRTAQTRSHRARGR